MKLNFWQWLGVLFAVLAGIFIYRREFGDRPQPANPAPNLSTPAPATQPVP